MSLDWKKLAPHRPLDAGSAGYVTPPHSASERIAQWIVASEGTVLLGGPVGIGKSTELAHTSMLLQEERFAVLLQLDRLANMQTLTPLEAKKLIVRALVQQAARSKVLLSQRLTKSVQLHINGTTPVTDRLDVQRVKLYDFEATSQHENLLNAALNEISRNTPQKRICLLIDGVEKSPEPIARGLFEVFALVANHADLVVVVPWYAAFGPGANQVIQTGEKFISMRAIPVAFQASHPAGRAFFRQLLANRLGLSIEDLAAHGDLIDRAAELSGGNPRTFLQLLADAAAYARIRGHGDWPAEQDLDSAFRDQVDTVRRILLPGDKQVLASADQTDGTEIELGTRIRLLSHGLLLEQEEDGKALLRMPPMVKALVSGG